MLISFLLSYRKLENVESLLAKHPLASAPDLEDRLAAWDRKQVPCLSKLLETSPSRSPHGTVVIWGL